MAKKKTNPWNRFRDFLIDFFTVGEPPPEDYSENAPRKQELVRRKPEGPVEKTIDWIEAWFIHRKTDLDLDEISIELNKEYLTILESIFEELYIDIKEATLTEKEELNYSTYAKFFYAIIILSFNIRNKAYSMTIRTRTIQDQYSRNKAEYYLFHEVLSKGKNLRQWTYHSSVPAGKTVDETVTKIIRKISIKNLEKEISKAIK